jgi:hypothetical protein
LELVQLVVQVAVVQLVILQAIQAQPQELLDKLIEVLAVVLELGVVDP